MAIEMVLPPDEFAAMTGTNLATYTREARA
jgi:hypothetical protein